MTKALFSSLPTPRNLGYRFNLVGQCGLAVMVF